MTLQAQSRCGWTEEEATEVPKSSGAIGATGPERCSQLSAGQLEVLRLVNRHLSSKEIGAELGISSHTVDQRVRCAG
jgi:DNA-binding NarL/FixJ family response regulator